MKTKYLSSLSTRLARGDTPRIHPQDEKRCNLRIVNETAYRAADSTPIRACCPHDHPQTNLHTTRLALSDVSLTVKSTPAVRQHHRGLTPESVQETRLP